MVRGVGVACMSHRHLRSVCDDAQSTSACQTMLGRHKHFSKISYRKMCSLTCPQHGVVGNCASVAGPNHTVSSIVKHSEVEEHVLRNDYVVNANPATQASLLQSQCRHTVHLPPCIQRVDMLCQCLNHV